MQRKTLVFGLLGLMGVLVVLAYAAGQQSNRLSAEQTNFNGYQSENHAKRLTAQVWDATMNALTTWAKNHESRLQVHGSVPGYPDLTQEQLSFSNLLSTQHNNALTSQMRDGLLNKLTTTITNHEMRLRALENKPVVKNGSCVGEYQDGVTNEVLPKQVPVSQINCYGLRSSTPAMSGPSACAWQKQGNRIVNYNRMSANSYDWWRLDARSTSFHSVGMECEELNNEVGENWNTTINLESCHYFSFPCSSNFDQRFCQRVSKPIKKSCTSLNETACKTKSECTWKQ